MAGVTIDEEVASMHTSWMFYCVLFVGRRSAKEHTYTRFPLVYTLEIINFVSSFVIMLCDCDSGDVEMYQVIVGNYDERQKVSPHLVSLMNLNFEDESFVLVLRSTH